ncbi:MAG: phosphatidylglycerophosphatase A [Bacteriovoracaceae bacterium]|nr:phosphatidylglycerophosphatase A [Bacteriovoracaceae bacterium]
MAQQKPSLKNIEIIFLSFGGLGFFPKAPGTVGSLGIMPFLFLVNKVGFPPVFLAPITLLMTVGACIIAEIVQKKHEIHDPSWIVIDEVIGMLVAFLICSTQTAAGLWLMFALFRFFDITKIPPANYFDKMHHGAGTILDDVVSGIYAGLTVVLIQSFFPTLF